MDKERKKEAEAKIKERLKDKVKLELTSKYGDLDGIIDMESYINYVKLSKHAILNSKKYYVTSDGKEINIATWPHLIRKMISHLPPQEQEIIEELKSEYFKVNNKLTVLKRNAYGLKQGRKKNTEIGNDITEARMPELLEYFGRMFTVDEVAKIVNDRWAIPVKRHEIVDFRTKHNKQIKLLIEKHRESFDDIRLGVKKSRMEELSFLYSKQKEKYVLGQNREDYKLLLNTLEAFRKEAEGERLTIDGKLNLDYENNINHHLQNEVFKTLNLKEIILAKVAARMNVNPTKLIFSLNASYYKRQSNVLGDFNPEINDNDNLIYPSQMNYDFERIKNNQKMRDDEIQEAVILEETRNTNSLSKGMSIREQMLLRLKEKNNQIKRSKEEIEKNVIKR
jgi:hypothetical protein